MRGLYKRDRNTVAVAAPVVRAVAAAVSGTGASSVPGALTKADLQSMMGVDAANVIGNTATTDAITWTFDSGTEAFDFLASGETLVLTYTISATDAPAGASDTQAVVVTVTGTNDDPVITTITSESDPVFSLHGFASSAVGCLPGVAEKAQSSKDRSHVDSR